MNIVDIIIYLSSCLAISLPGVVLYRYGTYKYDIVQYCTVDIVEIKNRILSCMVHSTNVVYCTE